jgi:multiple antibiotic resistance protein
MIFGDSKPEDEIKTIKKNDDPSVFPLAIPSIASPEAMMAAVMLTDNTLHGFMDQLITSLILIFVLIVVLFLMLGSHYITKLIGQGGASIISRVIGLLLASMAVKSVLAGITQYFF